MAEETKTTMSAPGISQPRRYYKVQMRAWTSFDPSRMELSEIAEEIDRGSGFLTASEILKVADDVSAIDDAEVRQSFENIMAAERILANVAELPKALRDRLYTALSTEDENGRRKLAA